VRLYKGTPVYFGEGAAVCQRRDDGVFGWIARLLGFPKTPCYQPADPPEAPCPGQPPQQQPIP
jgi:hypothetical protein